MCVCMCVYVYIYICICVCVCVCVCVFVWGCVRVCHNTSEKFYMCVLSTHTLIITVILLKHSDIRVILVKEFTCVYSVRILWCQSLLNHCNTLLNDCNTVASQWFNSITAFTHTHSPLQTHTHTHMFICEYVLSVHMLEYKRAFWQGYSSNEHHHHVTCSIRNARPKNSPKCKTLISYQKFQNTANSTNNPLNLHRKILEIVLLEIEGMASWGYWHKRVYTMYTWTLYNSAKLVKTTEHDPKIV